MSDLLPQISNVSNLAAFGVQWTTPESGTECQLVNSKGTTTLVLAMKPSTTKRWATVVVSNPERFGLNQPPKDFKAFKAIAEAFLTADQAGL